MLKITKSETELFNILPDGILIFDVESLQIVFANEYMCDTIGFSPNEFAQFTIIDVHDIEYVDETINLYSILLQKESSIVNFIPLRTKTKQLNYFDVTGKPIVYEGKECFLGTFRNTTAIFEKNIKLDTLLKNFTDLKLALDESAIIAITDSKGNILDVNDQFCKISKYSRNELVGKNHRILNSSVHPKEFFIEFWNCISTGKIWKGEICNRTKDGELYWVDSTITPFIGSNGKPEHYISIRYDITAKKLNEQKLKLEESRLISFISSLNDLVFEIDEDYRFTNVWTKDEALLFMPIKSFINKTQSEVFPKKFADFFEEKIALAINSTDTVYVEYPSIIPGENKWYGAYLSKINTIPGTKKKISMIVKNITTEKENSLKLKKSEELYRLLSDNSHDWICLNDIDTTILYSSPSSLSIIGYTPEELLGKRRTDLFHPDDLEMLNNTISDFLLTKKFKQSVFETRFIKKDGSVVWLETTVRPIINDNGEIMHVITTNRNIDSKKRYKEQLKIAEKISKIGSWELLLTSNELFWSDEIYTIFDLDPKEFEPTYENFLNAVHPEDRDMVNKAYSESVANKTVYNIVHRLLLKSGELKYVNEQAVTYYDINGNATRSIGTVQDITELHLIQLGIKQLNSELEEKVKIRTEILLKEQLKRINIEEQIRKVDSNYKMLFDQIPLGILVLNFDKNKNEFVFTDINTSGCKIERTTKNDIINKTLFEFYPYSKGTGLEKIIKDVYETGITVITPPRHYKHNEKEGWRELYLFKLITNEIVVVYKDITEIIISEQALKKSLNEKEILLNEVHHRVKNNLQIIIGLMQMQSNAFKDNLHINKFLLQSENRVKAMGLIHETIYQTGQYSGINIVSYIQSLYTYLCNAIGKPKIKFNIETDINEISISNASAFGIVLNEIISNSLKYAFTTEVSGEISVLLKNGIDDTIIITIQDNGQGLESLHNINKGIGIDLIFGLVKQINGEIKMETYPSFKYTIKIPVEKNNQNYYQ